MLAPQDPSAVTPPASDTLAPGNPAADLQPLAPSDRYVAVRLHAGGGLGEVHYAEDAELGRPVALKRIQGERADDPASRRRFLREAEVTARLQHPGIVPVYGLTADADGRPAYAMRFIDGEPMGEAIQRFHGLAGGGASACRPPDFDSPAFRDLLNHFVAVCNAVAYAHSRGVVHRDLKPANVMLGRFGETLVVDWGIAKTVEGVADDVDTLRAAADIGGDPTRYGAAVGTPAYMSPEQAAGRWDELGPASDVYSLGAVLYQMLTGRPPFGPGEWPAVQARIRRGDYPAAGPSTPPALVAVAAKAMAVGPAGRYASALELAAEVRRWLADEPVTAGREPAGVRLRRWVRKHARLVSGVAAALAVGMVSAGGLAWQRDWAQRAVATESQQRGEALVAAKASLARQERATEILGSVFADLDPKKVELEGKPLQAVLGERLDRATTEIEGEVIGDSLTVARMQTTLGVSQLGLGYSEKAIRLFSMARATCVAQLGPDHPDTLHAMHNLARGYRAAGKLDLALPLFKDVFELAKANLGPDHPSTLTIMNNLALSYDDAGKLDMALPLYEETYKLMKVKLGSDHADTLSSMNNLARGYGYAGKPDAAIQLQEEALKLTKAKLGPDHPDTLIGMSNLAVVYRDARKLDIAMPLFEETLKLKRAKLGPDHPSTLISMNDLALGYSDTGKLDLALSLHEEAHKLRKARLGPGHPETLRGMNNLAAGYHAAGKLDSALLLHEEAFTLQKAKLGPSHPDTLRSMNNLAAGYWSAGKLESARSLHEEAIRLLKAKLGPGHPDTPH